MTQVRLGSHLELQLSTHATSFPKLPSHASLACALLTAGRPGLLWEQVSVLTLWVFGWEIGSCLLDQCWSKRDALECMQEKYENSLYQESVAEAAPGSLLPCVRAVILMP